MKHTPAPWRVLTKDEFVYTDDNYHCIVAIDGPRTNEPGFNITGCINIHDAKLIAAAPELLQMLQHAVEWIEEFHGETNDTIIYKRIIKKATE